MALKYYDDAIIEKLKKWIPDTNNLRVLGPDESTRLFELKASDTNDAPTLLPFVALSRSPDLKLLSNIKQLRSFNGLKLGNSYSEQDSGSTIEMNIIPIQTEYQLDIYTKTKEEADEYLRNFIFKLLNNPQVIVKVPYQGAQIKHVANLRVLDTVSDTSDIPQHLFPGQFYRWTIPLELHDAFLFSIPIKKNWTLQNVELELVDNTLKISTIEPIC